MATRGGQKGNNNAAKAKRWEGAVTRALARISEGTGVDGGLDKLADQLVAAAQNGEQWALQEVGNRIDGKPKETVDITYEKIDRSPVNKLRGHLRPANTDTRTNTGPMGTH